MANYYNGVEIKNDSILSGSRLDGRSTVVIGGKEISLGGAPPPRPIAWMFSDTSGSRDPRGACQIGPSNPTFMLYGDSDSNISFGVILYIDEELTRAFIDNSQYYYNFDTNQYVKFSDRGGGIIESGPC